VQNLTAQKVCLALITLVFFIAAPWMTSETIGGNTTPLFSFISIAFLIFVIFVIRDRCWLIIPFTLPIEGNLNFLPLNFSIQEISIIAVFLYLIYRMIFGLNVVWRLGPTSIWVPLAILLCIIFYHWIESRDIGIKLLGGKGWVGRKYFAVMVASFGMVLLSSFPRISWFDLQKVPFLYFLGSFVDIVPDAITTFVPATAPFIWRFYSGVNLGEYGAALRGNFGGEAGISRIASLAKVGTACSLVVLCYNPARFWLSPTKIWIVPTLILSLLITAASGFRSYLVKLSLGALAALYSTARFAALLLALVGLLALTGVVLLQGRAFDLPIAMQRALSFLPGEWDAKAVNEAKESSKWREKMKALFYKEYFQKAPMLGLGYHYDANFSKTETDIYLAFVARQAESGDEYADVRRFIEMRQPHEGPIHALLVSGSVGAFFFCAFCFSIFSYAWRSISNTPPKQITPIQVWIAAILLPQIFSFFFLYGDYTSFLMQVCPVAGLLYQAETLRRANLKTGPSLAPALTPNPLVPRPSQS
jgi:hypothetical protein